MAIRDATRLPNTPSTSTKKSFFMASKSLANIQKTLKEFFTPKVDKRLTYHKLLHEYSNRSEPIYLPQDTINELMQILQHSHGTAIQENQKVLDLIKRDLDHSKLKLGQELYQDYDTRIQLYQSLFGDATFENAVEIVKRHGQLNKSLLCLLIRIRYKKENALACYQWFKSLLKEPWQEGIVPTYFRWSREACFLVLQFLCRDGQLKAATELVKDMADLDIPLDIHGYNHLLGGFVRADDHANAVAMFELLRDRTIPNQISYNWMIQSSLQSKEY
jgi:hypothetical protein